MTDYIIKVKTIPIENIDKLAEEKFAANSLTSKICVIGIYNKKLKEYVFIENSNESKLLSAFWQYVHQDNDIIRLIGWNSRLFDIPMLYQRTLITKTELKDFRFPLPMDLSTFREKNYSDGIILDLADFWRCGRVNKADKLYNMAIAFNLFENDTERQFFLSQELGYKDFYSNWVNSNSENRINSSKEFLKLQLRVIDQLMEYLV